MRNLLMVIMLAVFSNGPPAAASKKGIPYPEHLPDCPGKPNCVSSRATDAKHTIEALQLSRNNIPAKWVAIQREIEKLPRCTLIKASDRYLHAACKSRLFGFVDDLELLLDPVNGKIEIRSAAQTGYSDFGVNRRRVESLRASLKKSGLLR